LEDLGVDLRMGGHELDHLASDGNALSAVMSTVMNLRVVSFCILTVAQLSLRCGGLWHWVTGCLVSDVSRQRNGLTFKSRDVGHLSPSEVVPPVTAKHRP
jgi:hypothetical protein